MEKIGKYVSTLLIVALIITGVILSFSTKDSKWSFYFFATAVILTIVFSLFVLLGNLSKNKALMDSIGKSIEKGLENPEMLSTIAGIFKKNPYPYVSAQIQTNVNPQLPTQTPTGVPR